MPLFKAVLWLVGLKHKIVTVAALVYVNMVSDGSPQCFENCGTFHGTCGNIGMALYMIGTLVFVKPRRKPVFKRNSNVVELQFHHLHDIYSILDLSFCSTRI